MSARRPDDGQLAGMSHAGELTGPSLPPDAIPGFADWGRGILELVDVGGGTSEPAAPMRSLSIDALRLAPGARRWAGSAQALSQMVAAERPPIPAGIILHTGRCGSTLLCDMISAYPFRVLNEPGPINQLLLYELEVGRPGDRQEELRALMSAFSRGLDERGLVVKPSSWVAVAACRLLAALPSVPALFLWRPAAEVVASCLHTPPTWSALAPVRVLVGQPAVEHPTASQSGRAQAELASFYARAWTAVVTGGLEIAQGFADRVRFCSYDELRQRPVQIGARVAGWFGASPCHPAMAAMAEVSRVYSKDGTARTPFDPAGAHARPSLSPSIRDLVASLTSEEECAIRELTRSG